MPRDDRIDAYIDQAQSFARPILAHLRALVHAACPEVDETIKWGRPFFTLEGRPLAYMAAFQRHAGFGFWQGGTLEQTGRAAEAAGQFGRITGLADLPDDAVIRHHLEAAALVARAGRPEPKQRTARPVPDMPADLTAALAGHATAAEAFARLAPSHQREHIEAITGAKRAETRERRIAQALDKLMAAGRQGAG